MALRLLSSTVSSQAIPLFSKSLSFTTGILSQPFTVSILSRPAAFSLNIPGVLSDLWDSVLRAVPKKKTSHMKKRHRQMAGKALKDVKNLTACPACGQVKRAHVLCPHCVENIKKQWKKADLA